MRKRKTLGYDAYQRGAETKSFPSCYVSIVVVQKQLRKGSNESAPDRQISVEIRKKHENMRVYLVSVPFVSDLFRPLPMRFSWRRSTASEGPETRLVAPTERGSD